MSLFRLLNQIGLISQFIALWLVTPGIIGEERMREAGEKLADAADRLRKPIKSIAGNCLFFAGCGLLAVLCGGVGIYLIVGLIGSFFYSHMTLVTPLEIIGGILAFGFAVPLVMLILSVPISGISWLIRTTIKSDKTLLVAGACCFTIGFGLLLSATWFGP